MMDFSLHVSVPDTVLFRELDGEAVLLDLKSESYLGLDEVGTRMWMLVTTEPSIQAAYARMLEEFDVEPGVLRCDIESFLDTLKEQGLVDLKDG